MKKTIFLLAAMCLPFFMFTSCSKDDDNGGSGSNSPEKLVVTGNATDITVFGATISGWANIDPAYAATAKFGIIVSEDSKPSYSNGTEYRANELNSDNSYHVEVTGLTPGTKYYYLSYVRIGENYTYGDVKSFSTKEVHLCPDNHHPHAIDLGLPSGTKWCCCNVGATTPESYGGYYAWGETSEKSYYDWDTYKWCNGSEYSLTKYCTDSIRGNVDGKTILDLSDDVAHVRMGNPWRMPNKEKMEELIDNCTLQTWTQQNGVNGILVTGKNGGQIFLPAAGCRWDDDFDYAGSYGYYWSSSLSPYYDSYAYSLHFNSGDWNWGDDSRYDGQSVRAVCQ